MSPGATLPEAALRSASQPGVEGKRPAILKHVVQEGDTLWDIAQRYGTDVASLVASNRILDDQVLQIGQVLTVLTVPGIVYTVEPGDTLTDIAARYGISVSAIRAANNLDTDRLQVGQELILPGARAPQPPSAAVTGGTGSGVLRWPLRGPITSLYGPRWGRVHQGLDIAADEGTFIRAARAGTVEVAGWNDTYGWYVILNHGDNMRTLYAHASALLVRQGQRVQIGDPIAKVGSTGYSTGPHLHFEVEVNKRKMDPLLYLP